MDSDVGKTLQSVGQDNCGELYRRYLHDFVSTVHKCTHAEKETVMQEYKVSNYNKYITLKFLYPSLFNFYVGVFMLCFYCHR